MNVSSIISGEKGFTLLEALTALLVLTIGVLSMMTLQTTAISSNYRASTLTRATAVASGQIERLRALPYYDAALSPTGLPINIIDPATGYKVQWTVVNAPAPISNKAKDITITVNRPHPMSPVKFFYRKYKKL